MKRLTKFFVYNYNKKIVVVGLIVFLLFLVGINSFNINSKKEDIYNMNDVDIIAYVDGIKRDEFPSSCDYYVDTKTYVNNKEVTLDDFSITCDRKTQKWETEYTGYLDKIELNFIYLSFADDSWDKIANMVKNGMMSGYPVGSEKEVEIDGTSYTVRVANNTTPAECGKANFSQTACGFVVEFVDIIENRKINSTQNAAGGWPASELYTYANGEFFNKLPSDLQNVIIETNVISGHGAFAGEGNFVSRDKIYLLSGHEVFENNTSNDIIRYDTAYSNTRQLDYYASLGITSASGNLPIKSADGTDGSWFLRTAITITSGNFMTASKSGVSQTGASYERGFAPAFRIGVQSSTFAEDSWDTIANVVKAGQMTDYAIGSEKEVAIDGTSYTVRVANNTTPEECKNSNFSQTGCGFVVEFVDIVEKRVMNSTPTNVGGWPATSMRTYANGDFFNKLPTDLQNVIIDTKVISGHGSTSGETNFTSTDKIYLLSVKEVWNGYSNDSAYNNTRQLDYYSSKGVTISSYTNAIKQNNGSNAIWWLRSAYLSSSINFLNVYSDGDWASFGAGNSYGFAPAFRVGR